MKFKKFAYYDNMNVSWDGLQRVPWEEFHAAHRGALQQAWAYGDALASMGVSVRRAMVWQEGRLVALAQFIGRRWLGYISLASCMRGPVWHPELSAAQRGQIHQLLRRSLPLPWLRVALFSPDREAASVPAEETRGLSRVMTGYATVLLDLTLPLDHLKANLEGKWRNRLSKALSNERLRLQVQPSMKRCQWLLGKELDQREAKKFHGLPTDFVAAYISACEGHSPAFVVAYAELGKNTVAAMLFLIHGRVASYHMGWADDEGRQLSAHNALLWKAVAYLQTAGIEVLDLGGVNTHDLPGISRFKLGTGGRAVRLAGTYF